MPKMWKLVYFFIIPLLCYLLVINAMLMDIIVLVNNIQLFCCFPFIQVQISSGHISSLPKILPSILGILKSKGFRAPAKNCQSLLETLVS